jgi:3-dehydroquinate synthetase
MANQRAHELALSTPPCEWRVSVSVLCVGLLLLAAYQEKFLDTMAVDKKVANGKLRLILLKGELGGCVFTGDFDRPKLDETLDAFTQ